MSATSIQEWKGYAIHDCKKWSEFKLIEFTPKPQEGYDIDVKIHFCGVCGSDVHTITGGWGDVTLPIIVGHEIVGIVVSVGSKVSEFKVGDRVGVGAYIRSCFKCKNCKNDNEQYCTEGKVETYNDSYPDGTITTGGYSTAVRAHERFVFPIPDALPLEQAAPMMCAGLTVYSPLVRNGAGPGVKVGIVGIGGLGHLAIQFAKALGSDEVVAISHSHSKEEDAKQLGADRFVATADEDSLDRIQGELDLIICTADVSAGIPLEKLLHALTVHGKLVMVAVPEENFPALSPLVFLTNGPWLGGSAIGSKKEAVAMLKLAAEKGVKSWIEILPMHKVGEAIRNVKEGKVRYRHVLKVDI